ncbi:MAG: protease HtpX [Gammaproteobacteria bacterium]|nr:protease HtpX [Gammaproteobacteria bacterium]NND38021.1 protease HtpX [Pseudomonadales bacterium]MBT8150117.1 protease HtpX [Gammaproteobacteria bacterium]NNL11815.1 protease HtpX [Pseudomonadales bacterium]NNM12289.1 protease HtpX [Pseudomonadales bacterium]
MMRILLFLATNAAVLLLVGMIMTVFGEPILAENGVDLNLKGLLIYSAAFGFAGSFISLLLSKWMAKRSAGVQLIEQPNSQRERWLVDTVADLAQKAGIDMPEVGIFPAEQPNAFATGWNRNAALVAVSEGLLHSMDQNEVRAVLAHEVAHVANGDMITLSLVQGVVNTFVIFFSRIIGHFVDRVLLKNNSGHGIGYMVSSLVAQVVLGILASAIVMWFSRYREFRADQGGATLADKQSMINALRALQRSSQLPNQLPESMQAFGIGSGKRSGLSAIFASHPPLEDRIAALEQFRQV